MNRTEQAWDEGTRSATGLMTANNVHVLAAGRRGYLLLVADHNQGESAIVVRAIKRLAP